VILFRLALFVKESWFTAIRVRGFEERKAELRNISRFDVFGAGPVNPFTTSFQIVLCLTNIMRLK